MSVLYTLSIKILRINNLIKMKKNIFLTLFVFWVGFVFSQNCSNNLMQNPGFELGSAAWGSISISNTNYHSGVKAGYLEAAGEWRSQPATGATPGHDYQVTFWADYVGATHGVASLTFFGPGNVQISQEEVSLGGTGWQQYTLTATAPANTVEIVFGLYKHTAPGRFYIDDICLINITDGSGSITQAPYQQGHYDSPTEVQLPADLSYSSSGYFIADALPWYDVGNERIQVQDWARFSGNGTVEIKTIPGPYPAEFNSSITINIKEIITCDGYKNRTTIGGVQPEERVKIQFYKDGNLEGETTFTPDLHDDPEMTQWIGSLGTIDLPNGTDEIRLYNTGNSMMVPGICFGYVQMSSSCPEYIPPGEATEALTSAEVTMNVDPVGGANPGIVNSITVQGEPNPFTYLHMPDGASYNIANPSAGIAVVDGGTSVGTVLQAGFTQALINANGDRDLDHYMQWDNTVSTGDYVNFTYAIPIKSAKNRYVVATERDGNNPYQINALDASGNVIGTPRYATPGVNYIASGFNESVVNQEVNYVVYPLTAFVTSGTEIYGIRLTQTTGSTDGGDGKVFILADPFTLNSPPVVDGNLVINGATTCSAGGSVSFTTKGTVGETVESSISGAAGLFTGATSYSDLAPGDYTLILRYQGYPNCTSEYPFTINAPSGCGNCPEYIPSGNPTAALTSADVSMQLGGDSPGFVNSITVVGEPNPFTYLHLPDGASYQVGNPNANAQYITDDGNKYINITDPGFTQALINANGDRDLGHYMGWDQPTTQNGDYVNFTYSAPIKSAGNRYVVATERNGNNSYKIQALDANGNLIGTSRDVIPVGQPSSNYIGSGFNAPSYTQEVYYVVYPLTALVPSGDDIYGIRLTQNCGAYGTSSNDGGDGKIFILADPFSLEQPPTVDGNINITQPTCATATGTISFTPQGVTGEEIEYSINGAAGPFTAVTTPTTTHTDLMPGTYTLTIRYKNHINCYSEYSFMINAPSGCIDSDGDAILDMDDLDDDNDGILDVNEECLGYIAQNTTGPWKGDTPSTATITWTPAVNPVPGAWVIPTEQYTFHHDDGVGGSDPWVRNPQNTTMTVTFNPPVPASEIAFCVMDIDAVDASGVSTSSPTWTIYVNGVQDISGEFKKQDIVGLGYVNDDNVVVANGVITPACNIINEYGLIKGSSSMMVTSFTVAGIGVDPSDQIGYSLYAYKSCDTDGDGIPDKFDLDADNDGCLDALEGDGNLTYNNLVNAGGTLTAGAGSTASNQNLCADGTCVDGNGIPTVVGAGQAVGTSKDATQQADECDPCNANSTLFTDADGDGVGNECDLDDDNDGILDKVECNAPWATWTVNDPTPGYPSVSGDATVTGTINGMTVNVTNNSNLRDPKTETAAAVHANFPGTAGLNNNGANILGQSILNLVNSTAGSTYTFTFDAPTTSDLYLHFTSFDASVVELTPNVMIQTLVNGTGIGTNVFTLINDPNIINDGGFSAILPAGETTFSFTFPVAAGDNYFVGISAPCGDTDGDGTPDYLDLDSDNDGCVDALEGGGTLTSTDLVAAGGTLTGTGSASTNQNLCGGTGCVNTEGIPLVSGNVYSQTVGTSKDANQKAPACYELVLDPDSGEGTQGTPFTILNVLGDDLLDGVTPVIGSNPGEVAISETGTWPPGITLNTTTGEVEVAGTVLANTYTVVYQVCVNNVTPQLCKTTTVTIDIKTSDIDAVDNDFGTVNGADGGTSTTTVFDDDINRWYIYHNQWWNHLKP